MVPHFGEKLSGPFSVSIIRCMAHEILVKNWSDSVRALTFQSICAQKLNFPIQECFKKIIENPISIFVFDYLLIRFPFDLYEIAMLLI